MHHAGSPDPINLPGWEDGVLQERGWKQDPMAVRKRPGPKCCPSSELKLASGPLQEFTLAL